MVFETKFFGEKGPEILAPIEVKILFFERDFGGAKKRLQRRVGRVLGRQNAHVAPKKLPRFVIPVNKPIDRQTEQNKDETRPGILRFEPDEQYAESRTDKQIQNRCHGIQPGFIRSLQFGFFDAQVDDAENRKHVKEDDYKGNHVEQIAVLTAQRENGGPNSLHPQGFFWDTVFVIRNGRFKKEAVLCHRLENARAG